MRALSRRHAGVLVGRNRARLRHLRRRARTLGNVPAARDGEAVADVDLGVRLDVVGARQCRDRNAVLARNPHHAFAGFDDMHVVGAARRDRSLRRGSMACAGRHVTRNDHALAGPQHVAFAEAVRFHDGGSRHAVFARDALDRFAVTDRDRLAAVPGPMPARRRRRRAMRAHRSGDVRGAGPVSAQALRAGGNALRGGDGGWAARRRQRLQFNAARGRARGDRTGCLLAAPGRGWWRRGWSRSVRCPNNRRRQGRPKRGRQRAAKFANLHASATARYGTACGYSLIRNKSRL